MDVDGFRLQRAWLDGYCRLYPVDAAAAPPATVTQPVVWIGAAALVSTPVVRRRPRADRRQLRIPAHHAHRFARLRHA